MGLRLSALFACASYCALFGTLADAQTVEETIKTALQHSPQITIGEADTDAAMADRFRALGQLLPSVSATVSASDESWRSDGLNRLRADDGVSYSLEFSQPLFQSGTAYYGLKDADSSVMAQRFLERENRQFVAQSAANAHASLTLAREVVRHRTRSLSLLQQQVDFTDRRREAGAESLIAVSQARSRMQQEKAELVRAEAQLAAAEAAYVRQTGQVASGLLIPDTKTIEGEIISLADAIQQAMKSNPRLLSTEASVKAAKHGRRSARGQLGPSLSVDGQYNAYEYNESAFAAGVSRESNEFQVVARLRVPLFQQGQNYSGVQSARARLSRENAARIDARLALEETVTTAWNQLIGSAAAIDAAQAAVEASEIVVEGQQAEYQAGSTSIQDVLDGQRDLVLARISLSQAEFDYRRSRYELLAIIDKLVLAAG
ncbi:MAG: TolC family protein [Pseudomonadota bacterium]